MCPELIYHGDYATDMGFHSKGVRGSQQDATKKQETCVPGKEMKRAMLSIGGSEMA